MQKILAFGHQKRVGKDTAGRFIISHLKLTNKYKDVRKAGFADKLKEQCHQLFAWAGLKDRIYYDENPAKREEVLPAVGLTPRQIWIGHGMACRQYYDRIWIDYLLKGNKSDVLIVTDLRMPNEAEAIRELGGKVVKIKRPEIPHTSDAADDPLLNYQGWDSEILNEGGMDVFHAKVITLIETFGWI